MSKTPKGALTRITDITRAWETLRPGKSFSGLTLDQFKEAVKPSLDARKELEELDGRSQAAKARRDAVDVESLQTVQRIIHAVKSDPEEGEDGELCRDGLRSQERAQQRPHPPAREGGSEA